MPVSEKTVSTSNPSKTTVDFKPLILPIILTSPVDWILPLDLESGHPPVPACLAAHADFAWGIGPEVENLSCKLCYDSSQLTFYSYFYSERMH